METDSKLTIQILHEAIEELNKNYGPENYEIISHRGLPAQTIIKQVSKIYHSPDIKSGEVKICSIPENDITFKTPELNIGYTDSNSLLEMHIPNETSRPI